MIWGAIIGGALDTGKNNTEANANAKQSKIDNLMNYYDSRKDDNMTTNLMVVAIIIIVIAVGYSAFK